MMAAMRVVACGQTCVVRDDKRRASVTHCVHSLCPLHLFPLSLMVGGGWRSWSRPHRARCAVCMHAVWCGGGQCEREGMVESGCGGGQRESVVAATQLVIVSNNKHLLGYKTYIPNICWLMTSQCWITTTTVQELIPNDV